MLSDALTFSFLSATNATSPTRRRHRFDSYTVRPMDSSPNGKAPDFPSDTSWLAHSVAETFSASPARRTSSLALNRPSLHAPCFAGSNPAGSSKGELWPSGPRHVLRTHANAYRGRPTRAREPILPHPSQQALHAPETQVRLLHCPTVGNSPDGKAPDCTSDPRGLLTRVRNIF